MQNSKDYQKFISKNNKVSEIQHLSDMNELASEAKGTSI